MKKNTNIKLILLISISIFLYSSSITPKTVAQADSITIMSHGCSACNQETNTFFVDWVWSGTIPSVSIYYYNLSMTYLEYTITSMTPNNGTYEWHLPTSHQLDGYYSLVVCDYSNHNVNDTVTQEVLPIMDTSSNLIPGYSIILIGFIIGIVTIPLILKLRKR